MDHLIKDNIWLKFLRCQNFKSSELIAKEYKFKGGTQTNCNFEVISVDTIVKL